MNLLFDKDINNKDRFDIVLLINAVTEKILEILLQQFLIKKTGSKNYAAVILK